MAVMSDVKSGKKQRPETGVCFTAIGDGECSMLAGLRVCCRARVYIYTC